jgi:wobble nucleotide-excising tRNase
MLNSIQKVLNKDVEDHTTKLKNICLDEYVFDKTKYCSLDLSLSETIEKQVEKCNEIVREYNEKINNKIDNIYTPINIKSFNLNDNIKKLNNLLDSLEQKRLEFNKASKQAEKIKEKLIDINKCIAHKVVEDDYNIYKEQVQKREKIRNKLEIESKEITQYEEQLASLEDAKKNVAIAIEQINKSLEYVFFSKDRLSIELKNDLYYLKSNGRYVKPCDVSCGERNIIALCYFFTQIMSDLEVRKLYSVAEFVVIDDPVSSFDFENKVGIISFLKKQIRDIVMGNNNSKLPV